MDPKPIKKSKTGGLIDFFGILRNRPFYSCLIIPILFFIFFNPDLACRGYPIPNPKCMENGKIPDDNIVASSWQEPFHAGPVQT